MTYTSEILLALITKAESLFQRLSNEDLSNLSKGRRLKHQQKLESLWLYKEALSYINDLELYTEDSTKKIYKALVDIVSGKDVSLVLNPNGEVSSPALDYYSPVVGLLSIGLSTNSESVFTIVNSPLTSSGTLGINLDSQNANLILASPNGSSGLPTFRALTETDIPNLTTYVKLAGAETITGFKSFTAGLNTDFLEFNTTPTGSLAVGRLRWNDADGTLDLRLKGNNVTLQIGQESVARVVNKTGSNLTEAGYKAVRISGAQGQRLKIDLAQANSPTTSQDTLGLVTENINDNNEGFITTNGLVRNINTTGALQSETWADGDRLYLSPTTAGNLSNVEPLAPNLVIVMGYVVSAHATQGSIYVSVQGAKGLHELFDVSVPSPTNNNVLVYESSTSLWKNKSIATILGYTPADDSEVVHITGAETITGAKTFTDNLNIKLTDESTFNSIDFYSTTDTLLGRIVQYGASASNPGLLSIQNNSSTQNIAIGALSEIFIRGAGYKQVIIAGDGETTAQRSLQIGNSGFSLAGLTLKASNGTWFIDNRGTNNSGSMMFYSPNGYGYLMTDSGRFIINNTVDDGVNALQVNGNAKIGTTGTSAIITFPNTISGFESKIETLYGSNAFKITGASNEILLTQNEIQIGVNSYFNLNKGYHTALITVNDIERFKIEGAGLVNKSQFLNTNVLINNTVDNGVDKLQITGTTRGTSDAWFNDIRVGKGSGNISTNVVVGGFALHSNTTGNNNTAVGTYSLNSNTIGSNNTAIGYENLKSDITGSLNTAIGKGNMYATTASGDGNTALGFNNLTVNQGYYNIGIGYINLSSNTTGSANVAIGSQNLASNTTGERNVAIGDQILGLNTTGSHNIAFGYGTLTRNTTGGGNIALGQGVLFDNTTGSLNFGLGTSSLGSNTTAGGNVGIGAYALRLNTTGEANVGIGRYAGWNNVTGGFSVFIGENAGAQGGNNQGGVVLIGPSAGKFNSGSFVTAVGNGALGNGINTSNNVTAIGYGSLSTNTTGEGVVGIGVGTLYSNTTGNANVSVGSYSLYSNTTGNWNIGIGEAALYSSSTSSNNIAIGKDAMYAHTTNGRNIALGYFANRDGTTATHSIMIGVEAGRYNNGGYNVFIGDSTGLNTTTGEKNTFLGNSAGYNNTTGSNNIIIGSELFLPSATQSNSLLIGTSTIPKIYSPATHNIILGGTTDNGVDKLQVTGSIKSSSDSTFNTIKVGLGAGNIANNTVVGYNSLTSNTTGYRNTIIGYENAMSITTAYQNTLVGFQNMRNATGGINNVGLGYGTLLDNVSGDYNIALGYLVLRGALTGDFNIGLGSEVLGSTTSGNHNIGLGRNVLNLNTTGEYNLAIGGYAALANNTTGSWNTAFGDSSMFSNTTGSLNVAIGRSSLTSNTTGNSNVGVGSYALRLNTTGIGNIGVGNSAGWANEIGSYSTFIGTNAGSQGGTNQGEVVLIGYNAGKLNSGNFVTAIGSNALSNGLNTSNNVTAIGYASLFKNTTGEGVIGIGTNALYNNTTGNANVSVGNSALYNNTTGSSNIGLGPSALLTNTTGSYNISIGDQALKANTTAWDNVAIGYVALLVNTIGDSNIAIGTSALRLNLSGDNNLGIGVSAGDRNSTGNGNTFLGAYSAGQGSGSNQNNNTFVGYQSGLNNQGNYNTFIGSETGGNNTTGNYNTLLGKGSLPLGTQSNTLALYDGQSNIKLYSPSSHNIILGGTTDNGTDKLQVTGSIKATLDSTFNSVKIGRGAGNLITNTIVGYQAFTSNTTGEYNAALGDYALYKNTTGWENTAIGTGTLYNNTTGSTNVAVGGNALYNNINGETNVAVGNFSLENLTSNNYDNIAIGFRAGRSSNVGSLTSSNNSVFLGSNTKSLGNSETNQIVIGYNAIGNGSNTVTIGDGNITDNYFNGNLVLSSVPSTATAASSYNILARNSSNGKVEKISSNDISFIKLRKSSINALITGTYTISNLQDNFVPIGYTVVVNTATAVSSAATVSIGTNSTAYDNVDTLPVLGLVSASTTGQVYTKFFDDINKNKLNAADDLRVNVSVAATGTTYNIDIILFGYIIT